MNTFDDGNNNPNPSKTEQRIKKGKGRQKIEMVKIQNETNLQVTFSKRRAGVFKKASELSTLCGVESAVVVFSPGNKPHSFGHPNVETVANRFLQASSNYSPPRTNADQLIMAHGEAAMQKRNQELVGVEAELEQERRRKNELDSQLPPQQRLDDLDLQQLDQLKHSVLRFKCELEAKAKNAAVVHNFANVSMSSSGGGYSFAMPLGSRPVKYGYMVQYPPLECGSISDRAGNYGGDPVVPYENGTGSSEANAEGRRSENDDGNKYQGFGGNYRRPNQF